MVNKFIVISCIIIAWISGLFWCSFLFSSNQFDAIVSAIAFFFVVLIAYNILKTPK